MPFVRGTWTGSWSENFVVVAGRGCFKLLRVITTIPLFRFFVDESFRQDIAKLVDVECLGGATLLLTPVGVGAASALSLLELASLVISAVIS